MIKLANIKPPQNPWTKIEPPTPKNPMPILVETCKLKTNKGLGLGLGLGLGTFLLPIYQSGPIFRL